MKFIILHAPDGALVHIRPDAVVRVIPDGAHTRIDLSCGLQLVQETPDDVMAALEAAEKQ